MLGNNVITITATDPSGNLGRVTTTVIRTPDVTPPTVQTTSPASSAYAVGTNSSFTVTFSEAMDPLTVSAATILLRDSSNSPVRGSVTYLNRVATFTPSSGLLPSTNYTATVTTNVKDITGNSLASAYTWNFSTGAAPDTVPPVVSSTSPSNGATCVPTETQLLATFSKSVQPQTMSIGTFLLKDSLNATVGGTAMLDYQGQANFLPDSTLANSSSYTGTLTTGIMDLAGNHLASDYTWTFTTQAAGTGTWNATAIDSAPVPRSRHTAVWTGTEMIVWGGLYGATVLGDGARYDPLIDGWVPVSTVGAPSGRADHVAVWTGNKMIVWGGWQQGVYLASGGIYDPATDSWAPMSTTGAPSARQSATAVWTGTEMIVWGGYGSANYSVLGDGARYNPTTDSWSPISPTGAPTARSEHTATWTGSAMLVWGGQNGPALSTGGIYTPSTDSWSAIPDTGAPAARQYHSSIWTGSEMIIWGGWNGLTALNSGARYNPSANSWQAVSAACAPMARYGHTGIWNGTEMILWGGASGGNGYYYGAGGRYNPATDTWQTTPVVGMPIPRWQHSGLWTGSDLIVWGGIDSSSANANSGGRYRP
ncbi:Ig-like domain-containing protein [Sideroxydans sp. CL21]|uniref:Kelch repeat-containing protein n=1 Tax=Sideroxydans sp. CL21 TaxID=2600596 RepID=UPI0024BC9607|nr:Ig-like domain-containing protein [Sideroxydans sp. CL21]